MNIDQPETVQTLDPANVIGSVIAFPEQLQQTWDDIQALAIPDAMRSATKIVFAGMGGSALGASVARSLYGLTMPVTFEIVNGYKLPAYTDEHTLVMIQTYSGSTEESIQCLKEAQDRKSPIITISSGGMLEDLAQISGNLHFHIEPKYNPSNQPRMAIGYSLMTCISLLHRLGFVSVTAEELKEVYELLEANNRLYDPAIASDSNFAKQLAFNLHDRIPVLIASEHLVGATHVTRNQIHENAKQYADLYPIPELNHHLMEGLSFPKSTQEFDCYVFYVSDLYHERNQKRITITQDVVQKANHNLLVITLKGKSRLAQVCEAVQLGSYVSYYMALLNGVDPAPVPTVDFFKKQLA